MESEIKTTKIETDMPEPSVTNTSIPTEVELATAVRKADFVLTKTYLYSLSEQEVLPPSDELKQLDIGKHMRLFKLTRIAYDVNEDNLSKLSNVYNAMSAVGGSVVLIIDSDGENIDVYIGTKTDDRDNVTMAYRALERSLKGNFPGCVIENLRDKKLRNVIDHLFEYRDEYSLEQNRTVSSVSGISSLRKLHGNEKKQEFTQGIEKLIDSMHGVTYTMILVADPIPQSRINEIRKGYEQLYTQLVPFSQSEVSLGYTTGTSLTDSITRGIADTVSESLSVSQSHTSSTTTSTSFGASFMASYSKSTSKTTTDTESTSETKGTAHTVSDSVGMAKAISEGENHSLQIHTEERSVKTLIERIDMQLERLTECGDLGMWNCAAYFLADDMQTSKVVASNYQALIRGEKSGIEAITINTWDHRRSPKNYEFFVDYLRKFHHPLIRIGEDLPIVSPTALVSGAELTIQAGLPQKSIPGLAVAQYTAFGREIQTDATFVGSTLSLGHVFHMGAEESNTVSISKEQLTEHTFITGSTGSGKSNTVYQIVDQLSNHHDIPFLIIEPAKGEYKNIFGHRENVRVLGTNPKFTELLRINPFQFPNDIHVYEHIDRLISIFNVCWPMYAAMPAVLKEAILKAYEGCGWNLSTSENRYSKENRYSNMIFPTFQDLSSELQSVIRDSEYSEELKSNYMGALLTRVNSLTNGLNGQIFTSNAISDEELFDRRVIVDISRVGSSETIALIMGILIMRLEEYRMSTSMDMNAPLKHITVLEEAHNILKTSVTSQSTEGANVSDKSVEMITKAIAEMRTFGEGFIIADQSPSSVDAAAIKNTNTKIIMRLPDEQDRRLAGKSAGLKDEQLDEIARLPCGVAVVFQNNWIEPVLCKVKLFTGDETKKKCLYRLVSDSQKEMTDERFRRIIIEFLLCKRIPDRIDIHQNAKTIEKFILQSNLSARQRIIVSQLLDEHRRTNSVEIWSESNYEILSELVTDILGCKREVFRFVESSPSVDILNNQLHRIIRDKVGTVSFHFSLAVRQSLMKTYSTLGDDEFKVYALWRDETVQRGGVVIV